MRISADVLIKAIGIGVFVSAIGFAAYKFIPALNGNYSGDLKIVTFDVIKYSNAQRAVASTFLAKNADIGTANEILLSLPEKTRAEIESVAGKGTLVFIKQAVVQGQFEDITDQVLSNLRLPINVPTADATANSIDYAPTGFRMSDIPKKAPVISEQPQVLP